MILGSARMDKRERRLGIEGTNKRLADCFPSAGRRRSVGKCQHTHINGVLPVADIELRSTLEINLADSEPGKSFDAGKAHTLRYPRWPPEPRLGSNISPTWRAVPMVSWRGRGGLSLFEHCHDHRLSGNA